MFSNFLVKKREFFMKLKILKLIAVILSSTFFGASYAACLNVSGTTVERIGNLRILIKNKNKSIAVLDFDSKNILETGSHGDYRSRSILPKKIKTFRFFSDKVCSSGAESIISLNGVDWEIKKIRKFSN